MILQRLSLLTVLMCSRPKSGHSTLITFPSDTEVFINHSTYFNCSTSILSEQIHWYHNLVGQNQTNYVYYKGQFNKLYGDRYSIEINTKSGEYNLIIRSVKPGDAGRYVCQDDAGLGNSSSAELIVLESTPECRFSRKPDGVVGPNSCNISLETLQLSCSVSYNGNIPPIFQWKMDGNDAPILAGITADNSGKQATLNLTMSSTVEMDGKSFTCGTTRSQDKQLSCTTDPAKINYAVCQPTILKTAKGETITCSANASVPCTYRWFYDNDTQSPVSNNKVLTTNRLGNHSCEASCPISGFNCTFVAMRIIVFEEETSSTVMRSEDTAKTLLIAIMIPTVAILLMIIAGVLFYAIRKKRIADREHKSKVEDVALLPDRDITDSKLHSDLLHVEISNRANIEKTAIAGLTVLNKELFVAFEQTSEVEVFQAITFKSLRTITVMDLDNPLDMASSPINNSLYISSPNKIYRLDPNGKIFPKWPIEDGGGTLSVAHDQTIILSDWKNSALREYSADGQLIHEVKLPSDSHPFHAVKISADQYIVGLQHGILPMVASVDKNGGIQSFCEVFKFPKYLTQSSDGYIYAADQKNSCVLMLRPTPDSAIEVLLSYKDQLDRPSRVCLDGQNSRIFVADNKTDNIRFMVFKLQRCETGGLFGDNSEIASAISGNEEAEKDFPSAKETQEEIRGTVTPDEVIPFIESTSVDSETEEEVSVAVDNKILQTLRKVGKISTKASLEMGRAIAGVAALDDLIYVVSDKCSDIEMFDITTHEFKDRRKLMELENPWDLTSCNVNNCLYIMDLKSPTTPKYVIRVDSNVKTLGPSWSTGEVNGNLSVTSEGNVVVTMFGSRRLYIYRPDGIRLKDISLPEDMIHPSHALKLSNDQFLICHGIKTDNIQRVCKLICHGIIEENIHGVCELILNQNCEIAKNRFESVHAPSYLAADEAGLIFVADQGKNRVCVLNSDLELIGDVASKTIGLRGPQRLFLHRNGSTGKLFIVVNDVRLESKRRDGNLFIFSYDLSSQ